MKIVTCLACSLALSACAASPATFELAATPNEGVVLARTFESSTRTDQTEESEHSSSSLTETATRRMVVTDTVRSADDGRTLELERAYDRVSLELEGQSTIDLPFQPEPVTMNSDSNLSSKVEGATVTFAWNDREEGYVATSAALDQDLLDKLAFDLDCAALLPPSAASEGDEWTIAAGDFRAMLDPWHELPWDVAGSENRLDPGVRVEQTRGQVTATLAELRDDGDNRLAVIPLKGAIHISREVNSKHELPEGVLTGRWESNEELDVTGKALWNVTAARLHSLEVDVEFSFEGTGNKVTDQGDQSFETNNKRVRDGTTRLSVTIDALEG